jgi:hypothetical protein
MPSPTLTVTFVSLLAVVAWLLPLSLPLHAQQPTVRKSHTGWEEALGTPKLYQTTRARALRLTRADLDVATPKNPAAPYGVLVEIGKHQVTFVALVDGTASIYFTNGTGRLGTNDALRKAARDVLALAAKVELKKNAPSHFPFPAADWVHFYVLTDRGVFLVELPRDYILFDKDRSDPRTRLYFAALEIDKLHGRNEKRK